MTTHNRMLDDQSHRNRVLERATSTAMPALAVGDVSAPVIYVDRQSQRPSVRTSALTGKDPEYNGTFRPHEVKIYDMRQAAFWLSLDREGIEFHHDAPPPIDFYDDEAVEEHYYPQVRRLIMEATGASRVFIFDHTRRVAREEPGVAKGARGPARSVHNDYTPLSISQRAEALLESLEPAEAADLRTRRFAQINHWRPLVGPVVRMPLGLIDAQTLEEGDLIATDLLYPDRVGEIYHVAANPNHRWLYISRMQADEVLLIKGYDSLDDGRARFAPHAAFPHPETPPDAAQRESIEVRTLAFF